MVTDEMLEDLRKALEVGNYSPAATEFIWSFTFKLYPPIEYIRYDFVVPALKCECECGAESCQSQIHSDWCPRHD